jgi:valyl-tRNA synthetase
MNKIWNATRFALLKGGTHDVSSLAAVRSDLQLADRFILSRLQKTVDEVSVAIDEYRFDAMANAIYRFFWNDFCDVYIELSKGVLEGEDARKKEAARATLVHVLDTAMRLLHPLCPFLTEEIWQKLPGRAARHAGVAFCATAPWPVSDRTLVDAAAEAQMQLLTEVATLIRNVRQESGLSPRKPVVVDVVAVDAAVAVALSSVAPLLSRYAVTEALRVVGRDGYVPPRLAGANATGSVEVVVHLEGHIDPAKEKERLNREIAKADKDRAGLQKRFDNPDFVRGAPADVVAEGRENLAALDEKLLRLRAAQARLD